MNCRKSSIDGSLGQPYRSCNTVPAIARLIIKESKQSIRHHFSRTFRNGLKRATVMSTIAWEFLGASVFAEHAAIFFAFGDGTAAGRSKAFVYAGHGPMSCNRPAKLCSWRSYKARYVR